jgi:hypothetical protein
MARCPQIWEDEKRQAAFEERKIFLEDNKAMEDIIAKENHVMMMDLNAMDALQRERWWWYWQCWWGSGR